jgi:hypothetical protein
MNYFILKLITLKRCDIDILLLLIWNTCNNNTLMKKKPQTTAASRMNKGYTKDPQLVGIIRNILLVYM